MRILGARIFPSLLARKLDHFEQPILTNLKKWRMRILSARIFLSFLAGKLKLIARA